MIDKRLIKQKPIHIHQEFPEHDWELNEDGTIDEFAIAFDYHNGPACQRCGYNFCVHCDPDGWNKKPCIIDKNRCPNCDQLVFHINKYCYNCGQAIDWE